MTILKRSSSPFYYVKFTIDGVKVEESTRTTNLNLAKKYEIRRKQEIINNTRYERYGVLPKKTWGDAADRWVKEKSDKSTVNQDLRWLTYLQSWNYLPISSISIDTIQKVIKTREDLGSSPATINRILSLVKSILNRAMKIWGWVDKVPSIQMKKEPSGRIRWLTLEQARKLIKVAAPHQKPLIQFSLETGLRASNVLNLKWSQIDFNNKLLILDGAQFKSRKNFIVPLNDAALDVIKDQPRINDNVFNYKRHPIKQCNTKAWKRALEEAGIEDFRWHDLRHTWASWFVQNGGSIQELQILGGWNSLDMVLKYGHLSPSNLRKAINNTSILKGSLVEEEVETV